MKKFLFLGWMLLLLFGGCLQNGKKADSNSISVAVAANVQFAMKELAVQFERETGIRVETILSSSGKLAAQIRQGAPYDLFISADLKYPSYLYEEGKAVEPPKTYAYGTLVLWTLKDLDISRGIDLLSDPSVHKIGIPNPQTAPYGVQAMRALEFYGLADSLRPKLVYAESIAQTNQYILSGVCEIGFTSKSVVLAPELEGKGRWIGLDKSAYEPIAQGVVITKYGQENHPEASRRFYDYIFSPSGKVVLSQFGYHFPEIPE